MQLAMGRNTSVTSWGTPPVLDASELRVALFADFLMEGECSDFCDWDRMIPISPESNPVMAPHTHSQLTSTQKVTKSTSPRPHTITSHPAHKAPPMNRLNSPTPPKRTDAACTQSGSILLVPFCLFADLCGDHTGRVPEMAL